MAAFDFPSSPSVNQTYTANGVTWKWNGTMWMRVSGAGYLEKIEEGNSKIEVDDSGSGYITATTDGTERVRIDNVGWLGLNQTAKNHSGQVAAFKNTNNANSWLSVNVNNNTGIGGVVFGDSDSWAPAYIQYDHTNNYMQFISNAAERLRITSAGAVKVGANTLVSPHGNADNFVIDTGDVDSGISILSATTGRIYFGDAADSDVGSIRYVHTDNSMRFETAASEKLRLFSDGSVRIGDDSIAVAAVGGGPTLAINGAAPEITLRDSATNNPYAVMRTNDYGSLTLEADQGNNAANSTIHFRVDNAERMRINSTFLLYGDTASDLSGTHSSMFCGSNHAFQREGDAGTYLTIGLGAANGTVDLEADARSGGYPDLRFITTNDEQLRVLAAGHIWKKNDGALWHGTPDIDNFSNAGRTSDNNISIRAGNASAGTSPANSNSAIKIYPAGVRSTTTGNLTGGIAWQHLDPSNGTWDSSYGAGSQIWMGASFHDNPGQERDRFNLWMNSSTTGNSNPNNLAIEAYPDGIVRHPKVPAFMVRNTSNASAFSANSRATWNVYTLNNGSYFDMTNNVFTAPVDGIYNFSCMMLSNQNTRLFHNFRVNNTIIEGTRSESHAVSGSFQTNTITMVYSLSANDYVDVYVRTNNAYGGFYTNFNGFLVG